MVIDSHHHFWKYDPVQYSWISEEMGVLRRNFLPADLMRDLKESGVDGVVSVQARQSPEETKWLLHLAGENDFIKGVVGWLPLADPDIRNHLDSFSAEKKLVSLRHVIQDEPDPEFILGKEFNQGISELKRYHLAYDLLIFERQLPNAIKFVDMHPGQVFVLDHIAKPKIGAGVLSPWSENIKELAKRENVYCKISGMVTEADHKTWSKEQLIPFFEICLDAFGPGRLMYGSDWPVCLLAADYNSWIKIVKELISELSPGEQDSILFRNAAQAYSLVLQF